MTWSVLHGDYREVLAQMALPPLYFLEHEWVVNERKGVLAG